MEENTIDRREPTTYHMGVIVKLARSFKWQIDESERQYGVGDSSLWEVSDLVQEGLEEAVKAVRNYDSARGVKLVSLIYTCVRNRFTNILTHCRRVGRGCSEVILPEYAENIETRASMNEAISRLSDSAKETLALALKLNTSAIDKLAKEGKKSRSTIKDDIVAIKSAVNCIIK